MFTIEEVQRLRDEALIERLTLSVRNDRRLTVRLLVELGEVQARGLYRERGFSSMFVFATRGLGMSEGEAALRLRAAKLGRSVPLALELLGRSEVNLTTLSLLAPVLTPGNLELLHAARSKSKHEVMALVAAHRPKPDARDSVRRVPELRERTTAAEHSTEPRGGTDRPSALRVQSTGGLPFQRARQDAPHCETSAGRPTIDGDRASPRASQAQPETSPASVHAPTVLEVGRSTHPRGSSSVPAGAPAEQAMRRTCETAPVLALSVGRYKIGFTGSQRVHDLLRQAQDLRRHRYPAGELEPLFERALELLVAEEKKRKFALTPKPRASNSRRPTKPGSRHIPSEVRRTVWARDEGQCRFVGPDGQRCAARGLLEFHHVVPFAKGGPSTVDNIVMLCEPHNALAAERDFGRRFMQRCSERGAPGQPCVAHRPSRNCEITVPGNGPPMIPDRSSARRSRGWAEPS